MHIKFLFTIFELWKNNYYLNFRIIINIKKKICIKLCGICIIFEINVKLLTWINDNRRKNATDVSTNTCVKYNKKVKINKKGF